MPKITALADMVSGEDCSLFINGTYYLFPHMAEGNTSSLSISFVRVQMPFIRTHPHDPITFKKASLLYAITLGLVLNMGVDTNSQQQGKEAEV